MNPRLLAGMSVATALSLNLVSSMACSRIWCPYGVSPFDGATSVDARTTVQFFASGEIPHDLPDVSRAVTFVDETTGADVPFTVDVNPDWGIFTVTPGTALTDGHTYRVSGIDDGMLQGGGTWWDGPDDSAVTRFTVGDGSPKPLRSVWLDEEGLLVVAFSEPLALDGWSAQLTLEPHADDPERTRVVDLEWVGAFEDEPHLFSFVVPGLPEDTSWWDMRDVRLTRPDTASFTVALVGGVDVTDGLGAYLSLPHCEYTR